MNREEFRAGIQRIGVIPAIRVSSPEEALFAAEAIARGGIPIVELTMTVPKAVQIIAELVRQNPGLMVGAGTVLDVETARQCVDAGVTFLTSTGLDLEVVEFAISARVPVIPGALTPSEVITAWKAGADFVKIFPCTQVGGPSYIRALRAPLPQIPLIASGGVTQQNAPDFLNAGAAALGVGRDLVPEEAIRLRKFDWIQELAHRFVQMVERAHSHNHTRSGADRREH